MKEILLACAAFAALIGTPALAADMPLKAPPPPAPINNWTGFYLGIEGGLNVGDGKATDTALKLDETRTFGLAGGLWWNDWLQLADCSQLGARGRS